MWCFSLLLSLLMVHPFTSPEYGVKVERDVAYATVQGYWTHAPVGDKKAIAGLLFHAGKTEPVTLEMDIYLPEGDGSEARPLLLMMHGGSFIFGHKQEHGQVGWCEYFASLGYVAASIDYRLGFHVGNRKESRLAEDHACEDARAALQYLLGRMDLRIDPDCVFVAGTSAGAMTALALAYGGESGNGSGEEHPYRIRAIANLWGAVHDLSVLENASVPILSFQSTTDPIVPYEKGYPFRKLGSLGGVVMDYMYGTHAIHEKALSLGIRSEHHPCAESRHALHLDDNFEYTPRFTEIRDAMVAFFSSEMGE